jgi:TM2 domain-containing membrane protein YozV
MKQIFILLTVLSIITLACPAQNKIRKSQYDIKSYTYLHDDPYDPTNISITSAIIPGLGQMVCDEGMKGLGFLAGYAGGWILAISGIKMSLQTTYPEPNWNKVDPIMRTRIRVGLALAATSWLWSIIDAPRTAKIQNMKYREKYKMYGVMTFQPYIGDPALSVNHSMPVGISFNIRF